MQELVEPEKIECRPVTIRSREAEQEEDGRNMQERGTAYLTISPCV